MIDTLSDLADLEAFELPEPPDPEPFDWKGEDLRERRIIIWKNRGRIRVPVYFWQW